MQKQFISFLLLLSFVFSVSAQKAKVSTQDVAQRNLRKHISYLASDKLKGRRTGEYGATAAAGYIANMFAGYKLKPGASAANGRASYLQPFPYLKNKETNTTVTGYNVIGILEGRDKILRREAIVIGAHYDHLGTGGEGSLAANSKEVHHGADDNASGTAAIIEMARQFTKEGKNKRTIIFIAFSGEEEGLFGSKYYVNNPVFPIEKTVAMINLDMVGRLKDNKLTIGGIGTASEWKILALEAAINQPMRLTMARLTQGTHQGKRSKSSSQNVPSNGFKLSTLPEIIDADRSFDLQLNEEGFGPSDHSSFYLMKIPVLFFFTGTHLDYHKPSDTAEKINYEGEAKIIDYVAELVKTIDKDPARPTYTVAINPSPPGGRAGFKISLGTIPSYTDSTDGLVIDGVRDDSPAERAGLLANDKIVRLAGKEIKNIQDYTAALGEMKADIEYEIVIYRGSERLILKIIPVKR